MPTGRKPPHSTNQPTSVEVELAVTVKASEGNDKGSICSITSMTSAVNVALNNHLPTPSFPSLFTSSQLERGRSPVTEVCFAVASAESGNELLCLESGAGTEENCIPARSTIGRRFVPRDNRG